MLPLFLVSLAALAIVVAVIAKRLPDEDGWDGTDE